MEDDDLCNKCVFVVISQTDDARVSNYGKKKISEHMKTSKISTWERNRETE